MSGGFPRTSSFKSSKIQAPSTRETPSSNCQAGPCRLPVGETADKLSALRACGLPGFMAPRCIQFWGSGLLMNRPKIWGGQRWERIQKQSLSCPNLWVLIIGFMAGEQVQKEQGAFHEPALEIRKPKPRN